MEAVASVVGLLVLDQHLKLEMIFGTGVRASVSFARFVVLLFSVVTFITEQTLRKTRHFYGPLRALAARASSVKTVLL